MIDMGFISPDLSFKVITHFLLGKLPSCLVAFFFLLRLTFVARMDGQMHSPVQHILASVWVGILGWELAMLGSMLGLLSGLLLVDPEEMHAIMAYLSLEYDLTIALRGLVRIVLHAVALSWLLYFESVVMTYWQSDKQTRMTQFIFLGLLTLISIEVLDTVWFLN